jgi:hypothetical protein
MKRALSTEEPCAANVACTVLKASEGGDPFTEPNPIPSPKAMRYRLFYRRRMHNVTQISPLT